jgi:hypothetical protein
MRPSRFRHLAEVTFVTFVVFATLMFVLGVGFITPARDLKRPSFPHLKTHLDRMESGKNAEAAITPENRSPDEGAEAEQAAIRAYPADDVPLNVIADSARAWSSIKSKSKNAAGTWELIGPSKATYPAVLNFLGDGAQVVVGGRVTAMAIGPNCYASSCPLYVAAAGGGIWRTTKGLSPSPNWEFVSGSFDTNAIGSLIIDPNDPTGNTLYAGTGEPNVSVDSEAGVGIYKSTNGGSTWTLLAGSAQFQGRAISSIAIAPDGSILAGVARAIRGYSSVPGGSTSNPPVAATFGVYKSTDGGTTFTNVSTALGSARGVNEVRVDPNSGSTYYASFLGEGVWRSSNSGATWTQIKSPLNNPNNANNTDRAEFALANDNGTTRMYVGIGASGGPQARFYRANNAQTATVVFDDMTTPQNINYCEGQCWYDNVVYSPAGNPDVVYLLGSFDYNQRFGGQSNARAVLLSTDRGATWSDLTMDSDPHHSEAIHPDMHAIVTNPNNPYQFFSGSDGGTMRSDGSFADVSYKCDQRGLNAADTAYCKSLLYRVPNQLVSLNEGFSTLQFQSLSVSSQRPQNNLQGGTQDNGTFQYAGSSKVWYQEMYGDGGQSGFNSADDALRVNTFTGQANDANFRNGDPTKWVVIGGPILSSPEGAYFYPPVTADPNPAKGGTIFQGSFSVWRTQDWGGDRDKLEANCAEFTTSAADPTCGDFVRIGGATSDLTSAVWGTRAGGAVAAIERAPSNTGTLWAATGTGRVFISSNADYAAASSVVWTRIDQNSIFDPGRFPTSITVDSANPNHAWISYSGYNFNTPAQPGHVFEVTATGTWVDWSFNLPDLPITDLVRDDVTGDLYAASDFGVMRLTSGTTTWTVAGQGLPMVEVPGLTIVPSARILYAATHGRGAWKLTLP